MSNINEMIDLRGKRALITGAAGGLGTVICQTLAELGADLILLDREESNLEEFSKGLKREWKTEIEFKYCDLEVQNQRTDLINWVLNEKDNLNILVNNAALVGTTEMVGWSVPFEEQSVDTWRRALEVNLTAAFDLCKGLVPILRRSQGASVVNIASIYGTSAPDWRLYDGLSMGNPAGYAASKGGLIQLTRWLATTLAPDIRVNVISPGGILRNQLPKFVDRYELRTPLGRMATEDDIRGAIAYFSSDLSKYVTGQNLIVDGGWSI